MVIIDKLAKKFGEELFDLSEAAKFLKKDRKAASSALSGFGKSGYVRRTKEGQFRLTAKAVHGRISSRPDKKPEELVYQHIVLKKPLPLNISTVETHYAGYKSSIQDIANICDVTRYAATKFLQDKGFELRSRGEQTRLTGKGTTYDIQFRSRFEERRKKFESGTKREPSPNRFEVDIIDVVAKQSREDITRQENGKTIEDCLPNPIVDLEKTIKDLAGQWVMSDPQRLREFTDYLAKMFVDKDSPYNTQRRHP